MTAVFIRIPQNLWFCTFFCRNCGIILFGSHNRELKGLYNFCRTSGLTFFCGNFDIILFSSNNSFLFPCRINPLVPSCCSNGIPLDPFLLSILQLIHLSFLHAIPIPNVFHLFFCSYHWFNWYSFVLSWIPAGIYFIGSFAVIIHSMLCHWIQIQCLLEWNPTGVKRTISGMINDISRGSNGMTLMQHESKVTAKEF